MLDPSRHEVDFSEYFNPDEPEIDEEIPEAESLEEDANGYSEEEVEYLPEPEYNLEDEWDREDAFLEGFEQDKHLREEI